MFVVLRREDTVSGSLSRLAVELPCRRGFSRSVLLLQYLNRLVKLLIVVLAKVLGSLGAHFLVRTLISGRREHTRSDTLILNGVAVWSVILSDRQQQSLTITHRNGLLNNAHTETR